MEPKKKKILLVEDEAVLRESVRDWLTEDGYDVECVETGEEALEKIKKEKYGVIVLDLRLPGIDGLQVFEKAKQLEADTKGILITAFPSKESQEKARSLGLIDYLPKPFKVEELEKTITGMLGEAKSGKPSDKHVWLELGAVSYRLCTKDYECATCEFAQDIQDRFGTIAVIGPDEVAKLRALPANQRVCRLASVHFVEKKQTQSKHIENEVNFATESQLKMVAGAATQRYLQPLVVIYNVEILGIVNMGNPRCNDVFQVTGSPNHRDYRALNNLYQRMLDHKAVILETCGCTGAMYNPPNTVCSVDKAIRMDIYVQQCAVRTETIIAWPALAFKKLFRS